MSITFHPATPQILLSPPMLAYNETTNFSPLGTSSTPLPWGLGWGIYRNMEDKPDEDEPKQSKPEKNSDFKKPVLLVGKLGRCPKKLIPAPSASGNKEDEPPPEQATASNKTSSTPSGAVEEHSGDYIPYKEPEWGGLPADSSKSYKLEVLKSGSIIDVIDLMGKSFWIFGRMINCDISMQHPTVSRYHAVLQYRATIDSNGATGFYLYDLDSTHGTFLNKKRLRPKAYTRIKVGHMMKFGCSTRTYILTGPDEDAEEESQFSVTELQKMKLESKLQFEEKKQKEEDAGIDWGMGDDADEETDLAENPFAQTNNEELYVDDPKKALRGFMEREGFDLEYVCTEQRMGEYLCKVMLPLDDQNGRPIYAEVLHKGKKKEAVVQCALEACRILDRHGLLRQATHESRKRKSRDWEANDYYDSDEDTFLDRTGTIEKKRESRMKAKNPQQIETYQTLCDKEMKLQTSIANIEKQLHAAKNRQSTSASAEEDSLDSYMNSLKEPQLEKQTISRLKSELLRLKKDYAQVVKLLNLAKPAALPALSPENAAASKSKLLPVFGKMRKVKVEKPQQSSVVQSNDGAKEEEEEEEDDKQPDEQSNTKADVIKTSIPADSEENSIKHLDSAVNEIKLDSLPVELAQQVDALINIVKKTILNKQNVKINWNALNRKWCELQTVVLEMEHRQDDVNVKERLLTKLEQLTCMLPQQKPAKRKAERKPKEQDNAKQTDKMQKVQQKQYAGGENYSMWVPPSGQTGDGRTSLNEKLGY